MKCKEYDYLKNPAYSLTQECIVCGEEYQHLLPQDYHSQDDWHNFFDCCTANCLEHEFDYDKFKKEFRHLHRYVELFWKPWVISKALENNKDLLSPVELLNLQLSISYSIKVQRNLFEAGLLVEGSEAIAWGKGIEYPEVKEYIYYQ